MNILNKLIIIAFNKKYRVNELGLVLNPKEQVLKGAVDSKGYRTFGMRFNKNSVRHVPIHKLQAYQKYGDKIFEKGIVVRHLDGNLLNNSWDNIAIGTQSDNMMDIPKNDRILNASNPKHDHEYIIKDRQKGLTYKELMCKYNINSKGTISFIVNKSLSSKA